MNTTGEDTVGGASEIVYFLAMEKMDSIGEPSGSDAIGMYSDHFYCAYIISHPYLVCFMKDLVGLSPNVETISIAVASDNITLVVLDVKPSLDYHIATSSSVLSLSEGPVAGDHLYSATSDDTGVLVFKGVTLPEISGASFASPAGSSVGKLLLCMYALIIVLMSA